MTHKELLQLAEEAIEDVFSDTSVSRETRLESFKDLKDLVEIKIDILEEDLKKG